jgi:hypothetical protein
MIVSHEHKFIFLKTKKTAGTSIEAALSQICGPDDIIPMICRDDWSYPDQHAHRDITWRDVPFRVQMLPYLVCRRKQMRGFYDHARANRLRNMLGPKIWNSYFKFAFERNPWDRQVSLYHHRTRKTQTPVSFDDFMRTVGNRQMRNWETYTLKDSIAVDFVGRFENLREDLQHALQQIGVTDQICLSHLNTSRNNAENRYRSYYTPENDALIKRWYHREIDHFGYQL